MKMSMMKKRLQMAKDMDESYKSRIHKELLKAKCEDEEIETFLLEDNMPFPKQTGAIYEEVKLPKIHNCKSKKNKREKKEKKDSLNEVRLIKVQNYVEGLNF